MTRKYMRPVISTCFRPSSSRVVRAKICVATAEKTMCQHVRNIAVSPPWLATGRARGECWVELKDTDGMLEEIWSVSKHGTWARTRDLGLERYSRNPAVSINHLLKRIVRFEKNMYVLQRGWETQVSCHSRSLPGQDKERGEDSHAM